jgi:hypothetical protein
MTTQQLQLFNALYLVILIAVAVWTRATLQRIAGALAGAAVGGVVAIGIIALGETVPWWHMAITWEPYFLTLMWFDFVLSAFIYLITWRIDRRFGWRGLAVVGIIAAFLGPVRDYRYMEKFPEWGSYAQSPSPILAISATYVLLIFLGHGVMRLVAGPSGADRLARST